MRALRRAVDGVEVVEVDEPEAGPGAAVVHVRSSGICGSDLHMLRRPAGPSAVTLGHEFAGVLGDGTPVAVQPNRPCGTCDACTADRHNVCTADRGFYGVSVDGGLAERVLVDEASLVRLAPSVELSSAGLVEPLSVVVHALNRVPAPERLLVVGAGSIGLSAVAVARARGIPVDVLARHDSQREAAHALGAGTGPSGDYEIVVDAVGSQSALDAAVAHARRGGSVVEVGLFWQPVSLGIDLVLKEVTIVPAFLYGHHAGAREFDDAAAILASWPDIAGVMVTHRFALDDAVEAFRVAGDRASGAIKVQLQP